MKLFTILSLSLVVYAVIQDQTNKDEAVDINKELKLLTEEAEKDVNQVAEELKALLKKANEAQIHSTSYKSTPTYDPNYYKNLGYNLNKLQFVSYDKYGKASYEGVKAKYVYPSSTPKNNYKFYGYASKAPEGYYKPSKSYGYGYVAAKESKSYNKYDKSYYGEYINYKSYPSSASYNHYYGNHNYDTKPYCYLHVGSTSMRLNDNDMNLFFGIIIGLFISLLIGLIGLLVFYIYMKNKTNKVIEKKEDEKPSLGLKLSIWHWLLIFLFFILFGSITVPLFVVVYLGYMLRMSHNQNQVEREADIEAAVEHVHTEVSIDDNQTITDVDVDIKVNETAPLLANEKVQ